MLKLIKSIFKKKQQPLEDSNPESDYNRNLLRTKILKYLQELEHEKTIIEEQKSVLTYLLNNPLQIFPYHFNSKYNEEDVEVFTDAETGLSYVLLDDKKLFFKRGLTKQAIQHMHNFLLKEQDPASPHRYLTHEFNIEQNDVIVDVGSAEGNFALQNIDKAKKIYLFETNPDWIEALEATFKPWSDKIEIINKFVSDKDDVHNITLDTFCKEMGKIDFLKIDVDGAEQQLLDGSKNTLASQVAKLAICTYHLQDDEITFDNILKDNAFKTSYSNGYMIFIYDNLQPPYIRRGLIRAIKTA
ncbi:methyltransferase, FkbM family [Pedobacter sp. ok626]|uniref:FkbM family methyltransferase n=1 Tax=Pedobacter sp. ok626 TaxID=1761882 RepID=UPI00088B077A|nr:FkbM family methyltransferase [Pedobacter sp. ok626]SDK80981.1 methyltransferase, FkbM family [Pedobacter sp. ok626]